MARHYKHRTIARFTVGRFNFTNHIISVEEEDQAAFERELQGLLMVDQVNIVEVLNIENERPIDFTTRTIRGPTGSQSIKSGDLTAESKQTELDRREQELNQRAAELEAREKMAGAAQVVVGEENKAEDFDGTPAGDGVVANDPADQAPPAEETRESTPPPAEPTEPATPPAPRIGGLKLGSAN